MSGEACDGRRNGCDGLSEDDGENTAHVDLHWKVGALAAVHLTADHTLCVLYREAALGVVDKNDEHDHGQCAEEHQCRYPNGGGAICCAVYHIVNIGRESGNDACEQNDRNTVTDAELGDLFTQPHDKCGAGGEGQDDNNCSPEGLSVGGQEAVALDHHVVSKALEKADAYGGVTSDGCDLLLAFLAAFLAQIAELRECDAQQLNDNGSIDVRLDGKRKDCCVSECTAAHDVQHTENGVLHLIEISAQSIDVDIRNGDGITKTVDQDDEKSEQNFSAYIFGLPCVAHCLQHLDHLGLSACRFNFFFCGFRESGSLYSKLFGDLTVAEDLYAVTALGENACVQKSLCVDDCTVFKLVKCADIDRLEGLSKDVVEASLGDTACKGHLAAFKSDADTAAGACLLALVTAACGLAVAGCVASALAFIHMGGACYGRKFIDIHCFSSLFFRYLEEIADLGDLAPGLGVVGLNGLVADLVQSEGVCGRNMLVMTTVEALYELNSKICHVAPSLTLDLFRSLASDRCNLSCITERHKALHGCRNDICGVVGAQALGTDVLDAGCLNNCTNCAAGDNAGTGCCGLEQNTTCTELTDDLVRNGGTLQGNGHDVLLCILETLADRFGNFVCLAEAIADAALAVTDNAKCGELHNTAALDGLGYTVEGNYLLDEFGSFLVSATISSVVIISHYSFLLP